MFCEDIVSYSEIVQDVNFLTHYEATLTFNLDQSRFLSFGIELISTSQHGLDRLILVDSFFFWNSITLPSPLPLIIFFFGIQLPFPLPSPF